MKIQTKRRMRRIRRYGAYITDMIVTILILIVFGVALLYPLVKMFKK